MLNVPVPWISVVRPSACCSNSGRSLLAWRGRRSALGMFGMRFEAMVAEPAPTISPVSTETALAMTSVMPLINLSGVAPHDLIHHLIQKRAFYDRGRTLGEQQMRDLLGEISPQGVGLLTGRVLKRKHGDPVDLMGAELGCELGGEGGSLL